MPRKFLVVVDDSPELEAALTEFIAGNKREQRPMHEYSMAQYGLSEEEILTEFADYRARHAA